MSFAEGARRLAGLAGAAFGWTPDIFWTATPAELVALVTARDADAPGLDGEALAALMEAFPDG